MSHISLLSVLKLPYQNPFQCSSLDNDLIRCYEKTLYTDAEVRIQDKIFKVHKNILSYYSPIFKKAFYDMRHSTFHVTNGNITAEGFSILLRFLYYSKVPYVEDAEDLLEAWFAAKFLDMSTIKDILMDYILFEITMSMCGTPSVGKNKFWPILKKSRSLKCRELEEMLLNFAQKRFMSIIYDDFATADIETIKLVFSKKPADVPERVILERIAHWKESNFHLKLLEKLAQELLDYVDFEKLSPKDFYTVVSKYDNLMPGKDSLDILMHLVDPKVCPLPERFDKVWGRCPNIQVNLNRESTNSRNWVKADESKLLDDVQVVNNLTLARDRSTQKADFQSQDNLSPISSLENIGRLNETKSNTEAKSCVKTLSEMFRRMLKECLFTDVILVVKDNIKIPAHSIILALRSEVLANYLYGPVPLRTLYFHETAKDVKLLLRYIYESEEKMSFPTVHSSLDSILRKTDLALKYRCYQLLQACIDTLKPIILDPYSCWKLLDQLDELVYCKINSQVLMKYVMIATNDLFQHEGFYKASKNALVNVLRNDCLNMEEIVILEHVAKWLNVNAGNFPNDHFKKELLMHIRFGALNAEQFYAFLQRHDGLFLKEDSFAILTFLFRRSDENRLPDWCYSGPLRSVFYDSLTKIGTNVPIPWNDKPNKGCNLIRCTYTIAISDKRPECEIQFLELSFKQKPWEREPCTNCMCGISITTDDGSEPLIFNELKLGPYQRFLLPVFFGLNRQKPVINFMINVKTNHSHKFYSIDKEGMRFDNLKFEATTINNCISDAIVDDLTSEKVEIRRHLLLKNRHTAITTEECFGRISEYRNFSIH